MHLLEASPSSVSTRAFIKFSSNRSAGGGRRLLLSFLLRTIGTLRYYRQIDMLLAPRAMFVLRVYNRRVFRCGAEIEARKILLFHLPLLPPLPVWQVSRKMKKIAALTTSHLPNSTRYIFLTLLSYATYLEKKPTNPHADWIASSPSSNPSISFSLSELVWWHTNGQ